MRGRSGPLLLLLLLLLLRLGGGVLRSTTGSSFAVVGAGWLAWWATRTGWEGVIAVMGGTRLRQGMEGLRDAALISLIVDDRGEELAVISGCEKGCVRREQGRTRVQDRMRSVGTYGIWSEN